MTEISNCVACGAAQWDHEEEWRGFQMARCRECGLTFTLNPSYKPENYSDAYRGEGDLPVPEEHAYVYAAPGLRLRLETMALLVPPPRLTPPEKQALFWLTKYVPKGSTVIDCGCGSGRFLRALTRTGFRAVGVEISPEVVENLRKAGFEAIEGKAPDFPWDGPAPAAITFFEVLEHIPEPIPLLKELRRRFPETAILASVPSPYRAGLLLKGERGLSDYPPNHFLRWTPKSLEVAFRRSGYQQVEVILPPPIGSEMLPGLGQLVFKIRRAGKEGGSDRGIQGRNNSGEVKWAQRIKATLMHWTLFAYQRMADIVGYPRAFRARRKGASAASILVIARPEISGAGGLYEGSTDI